MNKIIAHRGWSSKAPENTLSSVELALNEEKIHMIEIDIQMTKDEEIVVIHDFQINRTSNSCGYIKDLNYKDIKDLDFGSWFSQKYIGERIPKLEEVLSLVGGKKQVIVEIKDNSLNMNIINPLHTIFERLKVKDYVYIKSFNHNLIKEFNKMWPNKFKTGFLFTKTSNLILEQLRETNTNFVSIKFDKIDPNFLKLMELNGIEVMVWTVDKKEDIKEIKNMGSNIGIITNYPEKVF